MFHRFEGVRVIGSPGRGCHGADDRFVIDDFACERNEVTDLAVRCGLRCDGIGPPLHGPIRWPR
jgi:hypothetical protein